MNERMTRLVEGQSTWEGEPRRPGTGARLLTLFVALLLVGGTAWIVISNRGSDDDNATTGAQQVATSAQPTASVAASENVPLPTAVPTAAPRDVTWELFQSVALPTSAKAGPRVKQGAIRAGYERSPEGALIAALQISTRHLLAPGTTWRDVTLQQVLPGPGRDRFVRLRAQATDDGPPPNGYGQIAGFKFVSYTTDVAVIEFASRFVGRSTYQLSNLTVRWDSGDWKLALQPDGSDTSSVSTTSSIDAFIPFGGV